MQIFLVNPNLADNIQKWLTYLTKNRHYSDKTTEAYQHNMFNFVHFINQKKNFSITLNDIMALKRTDFMAYLDYRKYTDLITQRSMIRNLSAIKSFYHYQEQHTGLRNDDLAHLTVHYKNRLLPKPIEQSDLFAILNYLQNNSDTEKWVCLRNYALGMLLYGTGIRISEALSLTINDVSSNQSYLKITGKGNKIRSVPFTENIRDAIINYLNECPYHLDHKDNVFIGVRGKPLNPRVFYVILQQAYHFLNIPNSFSAHSFRHSCASHLLNDGANLRTIQSLMGHKKLSATENYLKIDHNHLRNVINKSHPRQTIKS